MLNRVQVIGHLGKDPEVRFLPNGQALANMTVATSEKWKAKDGTPGERTEWHRVVAWGKLAEICGENLRKGRMVYCEGKLQTRTWQGDDGVKKYSTEIQASQVLFMPDGSRTASRARDSVPDDMGYGPGVAAPAGAPSGLNDEDVPF